MDKEQFLKEAEELSLTDVKHLITRLLSIKEEKIREERVRVREEANRNIRPYLIELDWRVKFATDYCYLQADICNTSDQEQLNTLKDIFDLRRNPEATLPDFEGRINGMSVTFPGPRLILDDDYNTVLLQFTTPEIAYEYTKSIGLNTYANVGELENKIKPLAKMLELARRWNSGEQI